MHEQRKSKLIKFHATNSLSNPTIIERIAVFIASPDAFFTYLSVQPVFALTPALQSVQFLAKKWSYESIWPQLLLDSVAGSTDDELNTIASALRIVPTLAVRDRFSNDNIVAKSCGRYHTKLQLHALTTYQHLVDAVEAWAMQLTAITLAPARPIVQSTQEIQELFGKCTRLTSLSLHLRLENIGIFGIALEKGLTSLKEAKIVLFQQQHHRIQQPFTLTKDQINSFVSFLSQIPVVEITLDGIKTLPNEFCTRIRKVSSLSCVNIKHSQEPYQELIDGSPLPTQWIRICFESIKLSTQLSADMATSFEDSPIQQVSLIDFTFEVLKPLVEILPTLTQLTSLKLQHINMAKDDLLVFAPRLAQLPLLSELILTGNEITDAGLDVITAEIIHCKYLSKLDMSSNAITKVDSIASILPKCSRLKSVYLDRNQITGSGISNLISYLKNTNPTIKTLDLAYNSIGTEALINLISATNSHLYLDLCENGANINLCHEKVLELGLVNRIKLQDSNRMLGS